ncbi:acyl-CoA dehydrogenase family protein [Glutamicibacter protophormiae]|uniref:acyl-CoA dehydrogenase family protein n=1 Tax=Glutamicibacter protophormiae TaxID=37930 RepID=UPI0019598907|nr:acyl-CoA dehydrogenase family protein [Glutamicibacter protophormiae]QRQ78516.1 acyl-CoA dehydrogenase family protein [Glutamicibacter protophormiae]WPR64573.1 acyl-CoA dehydrogenase family protein [Glutamicibacter protophormiae]WPR68067.1 acyl-CoA dehydrogenase family protein [Glutamicibacter protophormiae]
MDLNYSAEDDAFRQEFRDWLEANLVGKFAALRGLGGSGREHEAFEERLEWNRHMAAHGWSCVSWPKEHGGRGLSLQQQVIFHEEYARANAPARVNHLGEELLGPTLIAFGTPEQQARFLPKIIAVEELWCQGYSEPGAGSDLAGVKTKARLEDGKWVVDGQKVWTSLAHTADWCFVIARTEAGSVKHRGLSYLLVPMDQPGVEIRPILQLTGTSEFNEVFFDGAKTDEDLVVGEPGAGWSVAMGTLGFERGVSTLAQQIAFQRELQLIIDLARKNGAIEDPIIQDQIVKAQMGLDMLRMHGLRTLSGEQGIEASITKLLWAPWHRSLGELAMAVAGAGGLTVAQAPYELDELQALYLFSRADTLYGGSDEIQRNVIAERVLGLPKEARV